MKNSHANFPDTHHDASSNTLFGFWIYLMTDFILFAALSRCMPCSIRECEGGPSAKQFFDLPSALASTLILLTGSFSCGMALLSIPAKRAGTIAWFALTFLLGAAFLGLEVADFKGLLEKGFTWKTNASFSAYFVLVGTHGLHIVFGLLFTLVFIVQLLLRGFTDAVIRRLTCLVYFGFFPMWYGFLCLRSST